MDTVSMLLVLQTLAMRGLRNLWELTALGAVGFSYWCEKCGVQETDRWCSNGGNRCVDCCGHNGCPSCETCSLRSLCWDCGNCSDCCACPECSSCGTRHSSYDYCEHCELCSDCCECTDCENCGSYLTNCYEECSYCRERQQSWGTSKPVWETADHFYPSEEPFGDFRDIWGFRPEDIDPVQVFADYYLLDAIGAYSVVFAPEGTYLSDSAIMAEDKVRRYVAEANGLSAELVSNQGTALVQYLKMALWGEIRYHAKMGSYGWGGKGLEVERKYGSAAYRELARLFREFESGIGYGGEAWAIPADIIADYLAGNIPPAIMLDRICTLQHNNKSSSIWDKVNWGRTNSMSWGQSKIPSVLGPSQAARVPAFSILLSCASREVRTLWANWTRARDRMRKVRKLDYDPLGGYHARAVINNHFADIIRTHAQGSLWAHGDCDYC